MRDLGLFASIFGDVRGFGISNKLVIGGSARVAIFVGLHCDLGHAIAVYGWGQAEGRGDEELVSISHGVGVWMSDTYAGEMHGEE